MQQRHEIDLIAQDISDILDIMPPNWEAIRDIEALHRRAQDEEDK